MAEITLFDDVDYVIPNDSGAWVRIGRYSIKLAATATGEARIAAYFVGNEADEAPITELRLVEPRAD